MGSNGVDEVMISRNDEAECSEATVEIKIKTLDSQTYNLRVDKCVPVPALKDQIATVTGVLSEQQRLICRGKVLKDDQLLSAYHVEDGHTLHMVVRQPIPISSESLLDNPAADLASSAGRSHVGPSVVVGTFNLSEEGDGAFPDLGRIVSAVLSSFGISNIGNGSEGVDLLELAPDRLPRIPGLSGTRDSSRQQSGQAAATRAESDTLNGASPSLPIAASLEPQQPPVILDSLTTLVQYLSHMTHEFCASVRGDSNNSQAAGTHRNDVQESDAASRSTSAQGGLPTPAFLAEVMQSTRQLLIEQAAECLSQLTRHLENHANVTDSLARMSIQSSAIRLGVLLQNLGALLLELGRTTMTLRMGQTPADAVVNAGPAMFISTSGPNPIMVQPLPFQPGTSFGAIPMRTVQPGSSMSGGTLGSAFLPRNIDIRIRRGSLTPTPIVNQREPTGAPQSPGQTNPAVSSVANSIHQAAAAAAAAGASGSPSSARGPEVRVVPIRTVVAAVPGHVGRSTSDSSRGPVGLFYPVLARVQHITSGNSNSARGSQAFDERHHSGLDTERAPIPESAGQQQNNTFSGRDGSRHSGVGIQDNQENSTQIHSRLDQLLRTVFPGEEIHFGSDVNFQDPAISSATQHAGTSEAAANTQEAASRVDDEATFLSDLLRQVMPIISQRTATGPNTVSSERADVLENSSRQTSSTQENSDVGTSRRQDDSPSPPNSKRQKRE